MTEEEAKKRWCPFARATIATSRETLPVGNRTIDARTADAPITSVPAHAVCIGSACMAWRRTLLSQKERSAFVSSQLQLGMSSNDAYSMLNHMEEDNPSGYCGLAGTPTA